jgi:peptide-methionine (S)-S-oxide reductase
VEYDESKCSYEDVVKFFFAFHDPTTMDQQGNDRGSQYASAVFYHDDAQKALAEQTIATLNTKLASKDLKFHSRAFTGKQVTTAVRAAMPFFEAQAEHQVSM